MAAARKALEIDEAFADAHASLAYSLLFYDWDWPGAEREFRRAIELDPKYASAHQWFAWYFFAMGRLGEAVDEMRRAQELDPLSPIIVSHLGLSLCHAGRYEEALDQVAQVLELNPNFIVVDYVLGSIYLAKGPIEKAVEQWRRVVDLSQGRHGLGQLGFACTVAGLGGEARGVLERIAKTSRERYVAPLEAAHVHAGLRELDECFGCLERACDDRVSDLIRFRLFPWPAEMKADPRYERVIARIGLPG
jgi:serine/threonine-protein kinase